MKPRLPLYAKLLLLLALNLALLLALFVGASGRSGGGWSLLLSQPVRDRLFAIGQEIGRDLSSQQQGEWPATLTEYGTRFGVRFDCCRAFDGPMSGPPPRYSPDDPRGGMPPPQFGPEPRGGFGGRLDERPEARPNERFDDRSPPPPDDRSPSARISIRSVSAGYEIALPSMIGEREARRPTSLVATAPGLISLLRFLGLQHWLMLAALGIVLSVLLWLPFLFSLTRAIQRIRDVTTRIAEGRFGARVDLRSHDELGQLSESVNRMAMRLQRLTEDQRLFLADVAHEVTSPLSRLQIGLGILESRASEADRRLIDDLHEDAEQMSDLLREVLLFSRADIEFAQRSQPERFKLSELFANIVQRDGLRDRIAIGIDDDVELQSYRAFLIRALSNLIRNALRYAGESGPIELRSTSTLREGRVEIAVLDRGPGVPEDALLRLGDPFFRPEGSRSRDSGGFGLGLAIVRRCAHACGGEVRFRNREGGGFEARLILPRTIGDFSRRL